MSDNLQAIVRGLSESQKRALLNAELADCHEWWAREDVDDPRLAGSDLVLTPLGESVRALLQEKD